MMIPPNTPDAGSARYDADYNVATYSRDDGLLVCPVMGPPGTPPKIIRTHAGVGFRTQQWGSRKRGAPAPFPAMQDTPSGDTFLGGDLVISAPEVGGNEDQFDYVTTGAYHFVQTVSDSQATYPGSFRTTDDKFQTGRKPYQTNLVAAQIIALTGGGVLMNFKPSDPESVPPFFDPYAQAAQGWPAPVGNLSADADKVDLTDPSTVFYDSTIPGDKFASGDLIL
jgi:hypothetical protein